jgi:hypothetical protein
LDEALQIVDTTGERWLAAELNRRNGQLLLQRDADAAEERYGQALSIAAEQQARLCGSRGPASASRRRAICWCRPIPGSPKGSTPRPQSGSALLGELSA